MSESAFELLWERLGHCIADFLSLRTALGVRRMNVNLRELAPLQILFFKDTSGRSAADLLAACVKVQAVELYRNPDRCNLLDVFPYCPELVRVDMTNCGLTTAHARIIATDTPDLISLSLVQNRLNSLDFCEDTMEELCVLDLSHNFIEDGPVLRAFPRLQELRLAHNFIDDAFLLALLRPIAECPSLWLLDLARNQIRPTGVTRLAQALHTTRIRELILSDNHVGPDGATALARALEHPGSSLVSLDVNGAMLHNDGGWALLASSRLTTLRIASNVLTNVAPGPSGTWALEVLILDNNRGADGIPELLARCPRLRKLSAKHMWLSPEVAESICDCVSPTVAILDLSDNELGDEGLSRVLAEAREWPRLRKLRLAKCSLKVFDHWPRLRHAPQLRELDLHDNRIDLPSFTGLVSYCGGVTNGPRVDIRSNFIEDAHQTLKVLAPRLTESWALRGNY